MQNKRMEPKGYPKAYDGTPRGDIRLSSKHKLKGTRNFRVPSFKTMFCFERLCAFFTGLIRG